MLALSRAMGRIEEEKMEHQNEIGVVGVTDDIANHVYQFGAFTLDEECSELRECDHCVSVQPKVLRLLAYLIRHHDRVVTRSELLDGLWGVVSVVDGALTTAICEARRVIGDRHSVQWAIKTVPRRGYRFIASVEEGMHHPTEDATEDAIDGAIEPMGGEASRSDLPMEINRLEKALRAARARATQRRYTDRIYWP